MRLRAWEFASGLLAGVIVAELGVAFGQMTATTSSTVTAAELFQEGQGVIDNWSTVTALSSAIAIVNLLVHVTKFGPLGDLFAKHGLRWIRPLLATLLGALLGAGGALTSNGSVLQAVFVGLMAGLGSVGTHELVSMIMQRKEVVAEAKAEYAAANSPITLVTPVAPEPTPEQPIMLVETETPESKDPVA